MKIKNVINYLEDFAPPAFQENYDNSGLIVGDENAKLKSVLLCLDSTEEVVEEAIENGCNLIVAHHPILFSGIKSLSGKTYIERTLIKAIKHDIAIYAIHTNLDNISSGVNRELANRIGLEHPQILSPKKAVMKKLVFFCPTKDAAKVRNAIFEAGAGKIGEYDCCAFQLEGTGSFRAGETTNPHIGEKGKIHFEKELRIETVVPNYLEKEVINAMIEAHPYEEVAYDLYDLSLAWKSVGSGIWGNLPTAMGTIDFLDQLKDQLNLHTIRHTAMIKKKVKTIALCGGSGSFLLNAAKKVGADIFITADFKYHQFFDAENALIIADVGHYESEQFTPHLLANYLQSQEKKLPLILSKINTNPIHYR